MGINEHMMIWLGAVVGIGGVWLLLGKRILGIESRQRRRRSRNYGMVISRRHRPAVKLAVKVARS